MGELIKATLHLNSKVEISSYPSEFFLSWHVFKFCIWEWTFR